MGAFLLPLAADPATDVPGVRWWGLVVGILLIIVAIRFLFGRRR